MNKIKLISGSAHPKLAQKIAKLLDIPLTPVELKKFADGEVYVRVGQKVRGNDVYIIQSLVAPVNDNLMELLILIDALKRSSAKRINIICPYLCYSRQDRRTVSHEPITAKLVANLITTAGADRLITVDLHADQIQGFYDIPVDHFVGYPQFAKYLKKKNYQDLVIVSPDIGGVKRATKLADLLGASVAIIDKVRKQHNEAEVAHVIGDVKDKTVVMVDDIIDTGGSIVAAATVLKEYGAKEVIVCATHGLLSKNASERLEASAVSKIILLNSVPIPKEKRTPKVKVISLAPLLSKIISRVHMERSLGDLFTWENQSKAL
jgi:ribose-phosphate pyrophosphokinase